MDGSALCECKQAISVYRDSVHVPHFYECLYIGHMTIYISTLVTLYCTSLCGIYIVRKTGLGHAGSATDLKEGISSTQDKFNE